MRVVIADDEKYVLLVLKDTLKGLSVPVEIVGEAKDGSEAYEICCTVKPDLLITDICMPGEDGLTLLEKVREELPDLPVIIYSGYDDFSYAQKAIHYRIEEYLLKPIDEEKLEAAVRNIINRRQKNLLENRRDKNNEILRNLAERTREDSRGEESVSFEEQKFLETAKDCTMELFYLPGLGSMKMESWQAFFREHPAHSWYLDEEKGFLLVIFQKAAREVLLLEAESVWREGYLHEFCFLGADYPETAEQLRKIRDKLAGMDTKLQAHFWDDMEKKKDTEIFTDSAGEQYNQNCLHPVTAAIRLCKKDYLREVLKEYWDGLLCLAANNSPVWIKVTMKNFLGRVMLQLNLSLKDCEQVALYRKKFSRLLTSGQIYGVMTECMELLLELYQKENRGNMAEDTRKVIEDYLSRNYNQDITLEQLAAYLHFNTNYTSGLFKKIFGKTFVSYLTDMRMEAAKKLLTSGNFKVYEIARQVGYEDERYFEKTFKKVMGVTPKVYQKREQ